MIGSTERMFKMIRIGLHEEQKQREIQAYVKEHNVECVVVFSPKKFFMHLPNLGSIPIKQIEYNEIIMYRTFYPLLEEIGKNHLLVVNECLRKTSRNKDLTYNCLRHYLNQCGHQIIFEYFPFIHEPEEFMILLDFDTKSMYKGNSFEWPMLKRANLLCQNQNLTLNIDTVLLPSGAEDDYKRRRDELFNNLGRRDPNIIPRDLHLYTAKWKKPFLHPDNQYVARNSRLKLSNITTYQNIERGKQYISIDLPYRRLNMNDFLKITEQTNIQYISTGLSIDQIYIQDLKDWINQLEGFYAQAGIYTEKS